jgi:hypothetical protein
MKVRKTLQAAIICSLIVSSVQVHARKPDLPDEVVSAKTIAIKLKVEGGTVTEKPTNRWKLPPTHAASPEELKPFYDSIYAGVEEVFTRKHRFQIVSDPSKADLVCIVVLYDLHTYQTRINGVALSVVMILKGGQSANWDAAPVWVQSVLDSAPSSHLDQIAEFHDHLQNAEKKRSR